MPAGHGSCSARQRIQVREICVSLCVLPAQGPTGRPLSPGLDEWLPVPGPGSPVSLSEGAKTASPSKVGVPSVNPPRLSEAPAEPAHSFSSSQGHKVGDGYVWGGGGGGWDV